MIQNLFFVLSLKIHKIDKNWSLPFLIFRCLRRILFHRHNISQFSDALIFLLENPSMNTGKKNQWKRTQRRPCSIKHDWWFIYVLFSLSISSSDINFTKLKAHHGRELVYWISKAFRFAVFSNYHERAFYIAMECYERIESVGQKCCLINVSVSDWGSFFLRLPFTDEANTRRL